VKYRSRIDIVAQILDSASTKPISKTRLMSMTGIANEQLNAYAIMLIQNGLLNYDYHARLYFTTAKGQRFLYLYDMMKQCVTVDEFEGLLKKRRKRGVYHWQSQSKSINI
jgi:predicted transcriptional regulator